jgi:hypothetical protein
MFSAVATAKDELEIMSQVSEYLANADNEIAMLKSQLGKLAAEKKKYDF